MRIRLRAVAALAALAPFLVPTSAHASPTGAVTFAGFMYLPRVPCSGCNASFNSTIAVGAGLDGTNSLVVTNLSAAFSYVHRCSTAEMDGTASLSGVAVTGPSSISVGFHWDQVGLVAVVTPLGSSLGNPNTGASDLVLGAAVISDHLGLMQCTDGPKSYVLAGALAVV